jgi:hypothetical protein
LGRGTEVGLVCRLDIAGCVLVEFEEGQVFGLVFELDIAGCVIVQWEDVQGFGFFVDWILLAV